MVNLSKLFSFKKVNVYINFIVVIFLIIFLRPNKENIYTIRNTDYHTHCVKETKIYEESEYIDLSLNATRSHNHEVEPEYRIMGHSHETNTPKPPKLKKVRFADQENLYQAKYDIHLLYIIKGLVVIAVIMSTIIFNVLF